MSDTPLPHITHEFGPWSPMRFIAVPFRAENGEPTFWVSTSRVCRGIHDFRCAETQSQTFGPLVAEGIRPADVFTCSNCNRIQPPINQAADAVCLFCSDSSVVQHTGDVASRAALTAVAAFHGASATLHAAQEADPRGFFALLADTPDLLRALFDDASWAVKQDPARSQQTLYRGLAMIARQILANATDYAALHTEPKEPLPVAEVDGE